MTDKVTTKQKLHLSYFNLDFSHKSSIFLHTESLAHNYLIPDNLFHFSNEKFKNNFRGTLM